MLVLASTVTLSQQAPNRQINKLKVAVANFDLVGTTASTYAAWGQSFAESFQTQIVQSGRFEVYDRQQTSKLLGEVNFSQSGLTADGARKLKAQSINYLITGTITRLSNQRIQITFKIIDVETAKVEFQDEAYGKDDADFQQIATRFVGGLAKRYPLKGNILGEVGPSGQYYIDLGSASNVTEEATGQIFEITTQGGRTILVPKANFRVLKVINQDTAIIQVQAAGRDAYIPKANDTIQFDVATPVGPVSVPAALKGTLVIRLTNADVTGATVIINGVTQDRQLRSNQPLELSVESIPQSIIIRAPGFQDGVRNDIEVKGGSTTSVEITLLRLTSTVRDRKSVV